eukprot:1393524-Amorphochlora_amoeboformis.AAC.3
MRVEIVKRTMGETLKVCTLGNIWGAGAKGYNGFTGQGVNTEPKATSALGQWGLRGCQGCRGGFKVNSRTKIIRVCTFGSVDNLGSLCHEGNGHMLDSCIRA